MSVSDIIDLPVDDMGGVCVSGTVFSIEPDACEGSPIPMSLEVSGAERSAEEELSRADGRGLENSSGVPY